MVPYYTKYSEYLKLFKEAVEEGRISKKRLDDAVSRILFVKLKLGLYKKQVYNQDLYSKFGSQEFKNAARAAAQESITLLKNDNNLLPISKNERILLIGEAADNLIFQNGAWTHTWQGVDTAYNTVGALTIRQAFEKQIGATNLQFSKGYDLSLVDGWETCNLIDVNWLKIEAAMADKIVVCLGEMPATEKPGDIRSLNLPAAYVQLMQELASTGKPIVLVTMFGKPRIVREVEPFATAIFNAYLPGDYGSEALVDLVFGKENPSGKLPFTYPKYDGVIEHYDYTNAEAKSGKNELNQGHDPQWPFGFGMSYTSFSYTNLKLSKNAMQSENDFITAEITVTNTGKSKGKETVQWYITDDFASIAPANKRLKGFEKIELNPGESKTVSFKISTSSLEFVGQENKWISEKGSFTVSVGGQKASFELK
jgi:beta-glucosidase